MPNFKTEWIYSKVERSSKCSDITNFIVINPFGVLLIWKYPSPSINPTKKAKKDEGIEIYSCLSNLKVLFPFFKAFLWTTPIVGKEAWVSETFKCNEARYLWTATTENKITTPKHKLIIVVIIFDSTTSVPIQGIALIRLVILFFYFVL